MSCVNLYLTHSRHYDLDLACPTPVALLPCIGLSLGSVGPGLPGLAFHCHVVNCDRLLRIGIGAIRFLRAWGWHRWPLLSFICHAFARAVWRGLSMGRDLSSIIPDLLKRRGTIPVCSRQRPSEGHCGFQSVATQRLQSAGFRIRPG
jgi:hypothetical protein